MKKHGDYKTATHCKGIAMCPSAKPSVGRGNTIFMAGILRPIRGQSEHKCKGTSAQVFFVRFTFVTYSTHGHLLICNLYGVHVLLYIRKENKILSIMFELLSRRNVA